MSIGITVPPSGNEVTNGLLLGGAWAGPVITYSFLAGDMNKNGINDFEEGDWKDFYREITGNVETFANVKFQEVAGRGNINFRLDEGGGGESGVPVEGTRDLETAVGINPDVAASAAVVRLGTFSITWLHEIGHALGLKHPHDQVGDAFPKLPGVVEPGDKGPAYLNSQINTVMGYTYSFLAEDNPFTAAVDFGTEVNAQPGSYGAIDIAALQHLYGARAHNTGNDTYRFSDDVDFNRGYTTIWDTGGTDAIEYVGDSRVKIDLRAATLKEEIGGGGWVSTSETLTGGFTIANGVVIENATGNRADDIIIGNDVANRLVGRDGNDNLAGYAGDDLLDGGNGNDILDGGAGLDVAIYHGAFRNYAIASSGDGFSVTGEGTDSLRDVERAAFTDGTYDFATGRFVPAGTPVTHVLEGTAGNDVLIARDAGAWTLNGLGGNDVLRGAAGDDTLDGGAGNDTLDGGKGADTLRGGSGGDLLLGGDGNDSLFGEADADRLFGGNGDDRLDGGEGDDTLDGGEGDDILAGGRGVDVLRGGGGHDRLAGGDAADILVGGAGNDELVGDAGNDTLYGDAGNDRLVGGAGNDNLFGGAGQDSFVFAAGFGNDRIIGFNAAEDKLVFRSGLFSGIDDLMANAAQNGGSVLITTDAGDSILVANTQLSALSASSFELVA